MNSLKKIALMKQLCSLGNVEDFALIQYVINGIKDPVFTKFFLFGRYKVWEFEQKLNIYERLRFDYENIKLKVYAKHKTKP